MGANLFHLSLDPNLKVMTPRIPNNRLVRTGKEDSVMPRICFAPSIHSALAAAPLVRTGAFLHNLLIDIRKSQKELQDCKAHSVELWQLSEGLLFISLLEIH